MAIKGKVTKAAAEKAVKYVKKQRALADYIENIHRQLKDGINRILDPEPGSVANVQCEVWLDIDGCLSVEGTNKMLFVLSVPIGEPINFQEQNPKSVADMVEDELAARKHTRGL